MCSQMITACVSLNQLVSKLSVILVIIFARMYTISARSVNKFGISGHTSNGKWWFSTMSKSKESQIIRHQGDVEQNR